MAVKQPDVIDADDLTDADQAILDELQAGARTKKYIIDETGLHRNTVGNRIDVLEAGDVVRSLHETTALYELVDDPRDDGQQEDDVDAAFDERIEELEARLDSAREWLAVAVEAIDRGDPEELKRNTRAAYEAVGGDDERD